MAHYRGTQSLRSNAQERHHDHPHFAVELPGDIPYVPPHSPASVSFESNPQQGQETEITSANPHSHVRTYYNEVEAQGQPHRSPLQPPTFSVDSYSVNNAFRGGAGERHDEPGPIDMTRSRSAETALYARGAFDRSLDTQQLGHYDPWAPSEAAMLSIHPTGAAAVPWRYRPPVRRRSSSMDIHDLPSSSTGRGETRSFGVLQPTARSTQQYGEPPPRPSIVDGNSRDKLYRLQSSSTTSRPLIDEHLQGLGHDRGPSLTVNDQSSSHTRPSSQRIATSADNGNENVRGREPADDRTWESLAYGADNLHQQHSRHQSLELPHPISKRSKTPSPISSYAWCQRCKANQQFVSFCPACAYHYCERHWEEQPLHDEGQRSMHGVPHEKTDPNLVRRILSIIDPPHDDHKQAQLHFEDEQTKWFGVLPDETGQLQFHDWGRYEEFLRQSRRVIKTLQHPSLISFVGPTGAGKSTIVKALIQDFDSSEGVQQLQTPVVGLAKHQAIPTSGEVHLYWDHVSLSGPRPLLFADCEGLGGGSLAPASERALSAKQQRRDLRLREGRRGSRQDRGSSPESPNNGRQSPSGRTPVFRVHSPPASPRAQTGPRPPSNLFLRTDSLTEYYSSPPAHGYSPYSPIEQPDPPETGWTTGCDKNQRGFTRPIKWATGQNRNRQFIVENLYPRLLYTFSDVIVHVMRNVNSLEEEISRLISWAATAVEKSSNQPMLPYAIIVINAADNRKTEDNMLNVDFATASLLRDLEKAVFQNPKFKTCHRFWQDKHRLDIHTTQDLIRAYYSDIRIVLIPDKGWPGQVHRQYKVLLGEIRRAVESSQRKRQRARLLLSSLQFNPYLQIAYGHFAETLDLPFDFVKAFHNFSEPAQGQNPILSLFRCYLHSRRESAASGLLNNVGPLVGSCIALNVVRKERPGSPETLFPDYKPQIKAALKTLFDEAWPCEAIHPTLKQRCIIVRATHSTKGHQLVSGKIWSGRYQSSQSSDVDEVFLNGVMEMFRNVFRSIDDSQRAENGKPEPVDEKRVAFRLHKDMVIRKHGDFLRSEPRLASHFVCLCCLFDIPMHSLPCGHTICEECFVAAAERHSDTTHLLYTCPICLQALDPHCEIAVKPPTAGIRILSLDGGGIRAIIELTILRLLEDRIGFGIPVQEFFDLIVGTRQVFADPWSSHPSLTDASGGGIVALALGERNMLVPRATEVFKEFAYAAFTARKGVDIPIIGKWIMMKYQSRYVTDGLESSLRPTFGNELLFGGSRTASSSKCKVAVTTTDTNNDARVLANYNRKQRTHSLHMFQRFERPEQELSVWEAARATSAAPGFFKAFHKDSNGHTYWDGALKLNNPIFAADDERRNIWPESSKLLPLPDIVVSVGTGIFPDAEAAKQKHDPGPRYGVGLINGVKTFVHIGVDAVAQCLDCERVWDNYVQGVFPQTSDMSMRFHRLNVSFDGEKIELDRVDKMNDLEQKTQHFFQSENTAGLSNQQASRSLDNIAMQMIATLFYFEVTGSEIVQAPGIVIQGTIKCRLPRTFSTEGSLAKLARGFLEIPQHFRSFRIFTNAAEANWDSVPIRDHVLEPIISNAAPFEIGVQLRLQSQDVPTAISLHLVKPSSHTTKPQLISGFPRVIMPRQAPSPSPSTPELSRYGSVPSSSIAEMGTSPRMQSPGLSPGSPSPTPRAGRDLVDPETTRFA